MRDHRYRFTEEQEKEIAARYADGETSGKLAEEYGAIPNTIRSVAKRQGIKVHPRGNRYREFTGEEIEEIGRLWNSGLAQATIARRLNVHQVIISRVLRAAGYTVEHRRPKGAAHGSWRGGRTISGEGYVLVHVPPEHPYASMRNRQGYVPEHRLVMAQALGRPLASQETVHHLNGDRKDNRLQNLQLRQGKHGNGVQMRCADCGSHNIVPVELTED